MQFSIFDANSSYKIIRKKVEVSLRLFDIFEGNRVFIFLWGSCDLDRAIEASDEIDRVSKFDDSLSFGARQDHGCRGALKFATST